MFFHCHRGAVASLYHFAGAVTSPGSCCHAMANSDLHQQTISGPGHAVASQVHLGAPRQASPAPPLSRLNLFALSRRPSRRQQTLALLFDIIPAMYLAHVCIMIYLYPCLRRAFVPAYLSICLSISVGRYGNELLHFVFVLVATLWFFVRWFLCGVVGWL